MPLIGYARVSTEDQTPLPQSQALKSAGCAEIFEEHASGGNRSRPVLAHVLERIGNGAKDPAARRKVRLARQDAHMERLNEAAQDWVPPAPRHGLGRCAADHQRPPCQRCGAGRKAACCAP